MAIAPRYQDTVYIGSDYELSFVLKDQKGVVVDLSGSSVFAKFKYRKSDADTIPLVCFMDIPSGEIKVSLPKEITIGMTEGVGFYDVILQNSLGVFEPLLIVDLDIVVSPTLSPGI